MPPRGRAAKKAAVVTPPLDGCSIALSGSFPGQTQSSLEKDFVNALGATLSKTVSDSTTHLVTTEADFAKPSAKVKQAQSHDLPIVSLAWLEDCLEQSTRLAEDSYVLGTSNGAVNGNGTRKRSVAAASDDSQTAPPQPKKTKTTKTAKADTNGSTAQSQQPAQAQPSQPNTVPATSSAGKALEKKVKSAEEASGETNIAKSMVVNIPIDEYCPLGGYRVYIDGDGLIYDAALNQTNSSNNNNKFYRLQLLVANGDYKTWTRWGRVGDRGQSAVIGDGSLASAMREFESKFKSKSGLAWKDRTANAKPGKYTFIERSYGDSDSEDDEPAAATGSGSKSGEKSATPESKLDPAVQQLMALIFNQEYFAATMSDLNYDINKMPLGKLSKFTITKGYQALKDLSILLVNPSLAQSEYGTTFQAATEQLSNTFYSYIPHAFGRNRPPIISNEDMLKREIELLDSLSDMKDANNIMKNELKDMETINALDRQFKGLGLDEMTPLKQESTEFQELSSYLVNTRGHTHNANYQIAQIFRIERQGEKERFEKSSFAGPPRDRRLLWHGSRATNFGGILSQGLRIAPPEAPVSGYMFGKGIYLADMSSKSANYCCAHISNGHALLLLCEAELGDPMLTLTNASYTAGEDAQAKGMLSTWGQGTFGPSQWKDAGCAHPSLKGIKMPDTKVLPGETKVPNAYLMYNEYITYDVAQVRLRYLFRVKMH